MLKISMSGSETNCSCLGFRDRGSAGGGVMGAGDRVVMLRIFFWNLGRSLTPARVGAGAQISGGAGFWLWLGTGASFWRAGGPKRARNQTRGALFTRVKKLGGASAHVLWLRCGEVAGFWVCAEADGEAGAALVHRVWPAPRC